MSRLAAHRRPAPRPGRRAQARAAAGFTMVEVMVAIGLLTAGAVGIMALHQASTRGNLEARAMSTATQLMQVWAERLRHDALAWQNRGGAALAATRYLNQIPEAGFAPSDWFVPVPPEDTGQSYAFDHFGADTRGADAIRYCVHVRLRWVMPQESMRADVRTWWLRRRSEADATERNIEAFQDCARADPAAVPQALAAGAAAPIHALHSSVLLRRSG
ncbi:MAG: type IV pilus modification PilV family protein [Polyangiales bacterium]